MALQKFNVAGMNDFDGGRMRLAIDKSLKRAVDDCRDAVASAPRAAGRGACCLVPLTSRGRREGEGMIVRNLNAMLDVHGRTYYVAAKRRSGPNGEHEALVSIGGRTTRVKLPRRLRFGTGILSAAVSACEAMERGR